MHSEHDIQRKDGALLWTVATGTGPPCVLCHGGPGLWDNLAPVAAMLDDALTVYRWDQRGAGRSSAEGPFNVATFVEDLEAIREHYGHERWIVGGHSWGATLALCYALRFPGRTQSLLYFSGTGLNWNHWRVAYHEEEHSRLSEEERARYMALKAKNRSLAEERELNLLSRMTNYANREMARAFAERDYDDRFEINHEANRRIGMEYKEWDERSFMEQCRNLTVPVLVLHGAGDPRPLGALDTLIEALPNVALKVLPDAGHEPWLEQPDAMRRELRSFLGLGS